METEKKYPFQREHATGYYRCPNCKTRTFFTKELKCPICKKQYTKESYEKLLKRVQTKNDILLAIAMAVVFSIGWWLAELIM